MKIKLETRDGGLVHETQIPPFNEAPAVIGWGDRVFVRIDSPVLGDEEDSKEEYVYQYRECFSYALTDNLNH